MSGIAPITGLSALLNAPAQSDAGFLSRLLAEGPGRVSDGGRLPAAATPRPVAEPGTTDRADNRPEGARPEKAAAERDSRREVPLATAAQDAEAALRSETAAAIRLADAAEADRKDGTDERAKDPLGRFAEAIDSLRRVEPRDLTADRVAEARAEAREAIRDLAARRSADGKPVPNPDAPLIDDGVPEPVKAEVPEFPSEEAETPISLDDGVPAPVEPLEAKEPADAA